MSYQYAYLVLDLFLALVWICFFFARKDLRHQQLVMSILCAPMSLTMYWFYRDYWTPLWILPIRLGHSYFGLEDILFAFLIGGISSVMYEIIFNKTYRHGKRRTIAAFGLAIAGGILFLLLKHLGLNTIWATSFMFVILTGVIGVWDRNVRLDAILSASSMFVLITVIYSAWRLLYPDVFSRFWVTTNFSGVVLLHIPVEEIVWYVSAALFAGIYYEFTVRAGVYTNISRTRSRTSGNRS